MPTLVFCTKCPNATLLDMAYVENGKIVCSECKTEKSVKIPKEIDDQVEALSKCDDTIEN